VGVGQDEAVRVDDEPGPVGRRHRLAGEEVDAAVVLDLNVDDGRGRLLDDVGDEVEVVAAGRVLAADDVRVVRADWRRSLQRKG
jgi:hypothetical protein